MKPRQRLPQKQTARLYCRKNDHRDILWYDETLQKMVYHNALYWTEEDDTSIDRNKIAWIKYPKNALLFAHIGYGWVDIDRQFSYGASLGGGVYGNSMMHRFDTEDLHFAVAMLQNRDMRLTEDGIVYQKITPNVNTDNFDIYKIGQTGVLSFNSGIANVIDFVKNEETSKWDIQKYAYNMMQKIGTNSPYVMGYTDTGILLIKEVVDGESYSTQWFIYHMDIEGNVTELSPPVPPLTKKFLTYSKYQGMRIGTRNFFALFNRYRLWQSPDYYNDRYRNTLIAMISMDDGETWHEETLFTYDDGYGSGYETRNKLQLFSRDGIAYIICGQTNASVDDGHSAYDVRMFESITGTSWSEIPLPKWVDLPVLNEPSGACIAPSSVETIRVAIRPSETSDYNAIMYDCVPNRGESPYSLDYGSYNILFEDGELTDKFNEDFYMCLASGSLHLYFNNKYMAESTKAFAFYTKSFDSADVLPDYVIPYDYCAPGGAVTTETEENNG